jgi:hypothetical protein
MLKFLLAAAVGYVLGARAGRERYEQLLRTYQRTYERIADHPAVQGAAGVLRARAEETVNGHKHEDHSGEGARRRPGAVR